MTKVEHQRAPWRDPSREQEGKPQITGWQPIERLDPVLKDGRNLLLHVDWEPLTVVGYWGPGKADYSQSTDPFGAHYDDGEPTWRVRWCEQPLSWGFDEPTHWLEYPSPPLDVKP